jgi:DNA polymerase (family 10)
VPLPNAEIARVLREIADLLEIQSANPFRVRAYRNAARTVEEHPDSVAAIAARDPKALTEIPGVGKDLAVTIAEIAKDGSAKQLRDLKAEVPAGALEMRAVPNVGPKRARILAERLGIRTREALLEAARAGRLANEPGLGAAIQAKILRDLEAHREEEHRISRAAAAQYAEPLLARLRRVPGVTAAEIAGSFRRARESVGDIDMLARAEDPSKVIDAFTSAPEAADVIERGASKAAIRLQNGMRVDLRVFDRESYGAGLHYFTGSKAHNIAVRKLGQAKGLKINEYGVWKGERRVSGREEQDVLDAVGLPWIPPEMREDRGEIEAARAGKLPNVVRLADIKGDLQSHSTGSDGRNTIEEMARAAEALGYEYLAITDHSPAVRVTNGMDDAGFKRQAKAIDKLNAKLEKLTVLKGAEVDIHKDGTLDLSDATLAALDIVLVSIHSYFDLPPAAQTARVVKALSHRCVDVFAHPTARLIGRRRPAAFDLDAAIRAALDHGVMMEIDAQPERLDLDDVSARSAHERGVMLTIGTDAHAVAELAGMRWGVDQARRAWVDKKGIANTRSLARLMKLLHASR